MSCSRVTPNLLMRNVSLSLSRSLRKRKDHLLIHVQSVYGWPAPMDDRYAAVTP